ncbi:MAG: hypothetical protein IPJ65_39175 [Archangiaceae bacterium]|nr:hypothetical protein [Archangiaceae bacterium]
MSLFACTWLALAAVPCTERGVVLFDSGPGPDDATRQAIAEQLRVELSALVPALRRRPAAHAGLVPLVVAAAR